MTWYLTDIVEAVEAGLRKQAEADDLEQAVYSIDSRDELGVHPLIQASLRTAGFGVWPEQRYPSDRSSRRRSEGKRCDIVLTPEGRPLVSPEAEDTLFQPPDAVPLDSAFWLEIKTVSQFTSEGPFRRYSAELLQPVSKDVKKLAGDPQIFHAALMLVLFTADAFTAEHDLAAWHSRCLDRRYPVSSPVVRAFQIRDRLGNGYASVAAFPVRHL